VAVVEALAVEEEILAFSLRRNAEKSYRTLAASDQHSRRAGDDNT
jgi:hypothetical protein